MTKVIRVKTMTRLKKPVRKSLRTSNTMTRKTRKKKLMSGLTTLVQERLYLTLLSNKTLTL